MYATRLGLTWNDRISFVLTEKLQVKRVEFLAIDKDAGAGRQDESASSRRRSSSRSTSC